MSDPETQAVRNGEELNVESLRDFLTERLGHRGALLTVEQFPAGSSNLTYLVRFGDDELVLRRPPFGNTVKTAHDMRREFDVLSKLSTAYPPAPKPRLFCADVSVLGSEFYLMERREGLVIRGRSPEKLKSSPDLQRKVCKSFVENLAKLHSLDHDAAGLGDLGHPDGYNRRQVEGWTKRYATAKTHDHSELEAVIEWINVNIPNEFGSSLIHNDYKFDNVVLAPDDLTKITAVLDWEMVTVGDPLMDLGMTLGYWMTAEAGEEMLNMPFNPRVLMENISRKELVGIYAEATEREIPEMLFYYVFGTFKIAVICQQIYARYAKGFTRDERFAGFHHFVAALGRIAVGALKRGGI